LVAEFNEAEVELTQWDYEKVFQACEVGSQFDWGEYVKEEAAQVGHVVDDFGSPEEAKAYMQEKWRRQQEKRKKQRLEPQRLTRIC